MKILRKFIGLNEFKPMNKKIFVYFILVVLFAVYVNGAQRTQRPASDYDVVVTLINQDPDPAEPGNFVDVRFKFDNNGTEEARNVEVEILPEYPFSLYSGDRFRTIGTLQSRQKGDVGVIVKYRLRVDENAVEGENELRIKYRIDKQAWIEPEEFMIDVQTQDAILEVDSIISAEGITPGISSLLKIRIKNMADSLLKDIKVKLDLGSVPLVPIGSTNEKTLYQLGSKESYDIEFKLMAEPDAESKLYKVPLKLEYFDELGKSYVKNQTIGLTIGSKPDLSVTLDKSEIFEPAKSGEIVVKVVNKGVTGIKFMNVKLMPSGNYKILSSDEAYLGNIDSDDFETADFRLFVESTDKKQVILPIILEYKDTNNNDYKDSIELTLNLYTAAEAKKLGLKNENGFVGILIVIIIVALGLWYYRNQRKNKKKA